MLHNTRNQGALGKGGGGGETLGHCATARMSAMSVTSWLRVSCNGRRRSLSALFRDVLVLSRRLPWRVIADVGLRGSQRPTRRSTDQPFGLASRPTPTPATTSRNVDEPPLAGTLKVPCHLNTLHFARSWQGPCCSSSSKRQQLQREKKYQTERESSSQHV